MIRVARRGVERGALARFIVAFISCQDLAIRIVFMLKRRERCAPRAIASLRLCVGSLRFFADEIFG